MNDFWEDDRIKEGENSARELVASNYLREAIPHLRALRKWAKRMNDETLSDLMRELLELCSVVHDEALSREEEKDDRTTDRPEQPEP